MFPPRSDQIKTKYIFPKLPPLPVVHTVVHTNTQYGYRWVCHERGHRSMQCCVVRLLRLRLLRTMHAVGKRYVKPLRQLFVPHDHGLLFYPGTDVAALWGADL